MMIPTNYRIPPNAVDILWFNDFIIYTVQDAYQHTPKNEITYSSYGYRMQDNLKFRVGGPTESNFVPHRSKVVLLWAMKKAQEFPPLPIYTIPVPDYDNFKITVSRVPGDPRGQWFVGKAEKDGLVIESENMEHEKLIIDLRLKIDRYSSLFQDLKFLSERAAKSNAYKYDTFSKQLCQEMATKGSLEPLLSISKSMVDDEELQS